MDPTLTPRRTTWLRRVLIPGEPALRIGRLNVSWVLPAALLAAIAIGDWNSSGDFRIITWIVLVPGIAAALCGVAATLIFGVLSVLTYVVLDNAWDYSYQKGPADFLLVVAGAALAVLASWLSGRARGHIRRVVNAADAIRLAVLRPIPPGAGGLDTASLYLTADIETRVGGDFFDVQPSPHGARVLLGDVQGKGTGAVDAAAALLSAFREAAYYERDLAVVAERLESRMRRHNGYMAELGQRDERFATAVLVGFPATGTDCVELVNFGHGGPLALTPSDVRSLPEGTGAPLGLAGLAGGLPPVLRVPFGTGETLLLVTDGVTEARDGNGAFLPLAEHLLRAGDDLAPQSVVTRVEVAVLAHTRGRLADDTAILAVRRMPPCPADPAR
ncbi:PP2C family protein-serine/threonine phosphatase [Streptomyces sp. MP131-18]|uniref:PP2C family protein-serine/threonine phosphatase n=1 Tax=Streptomyces sp. MP131-18 TaxID=1857892 RepID=UPI0009C42942|nr:PP2C family protein-serine/threonine phosphatase [Streptomyces sp. MP131-18]ONK14462.1 Stage II sporulation protein E (SpoIIE) [Streptomyces sp. MP131-18]